MSILPNMLSITVADEDTENNGCDDNEDDDGYIEDMGIVLSDFNNISHEDCQEYDKNDEGNDVSNS